MDHQFTEKIKQWLDTPETERDYGDGALMMLKLSGNRVMYRNVTASLDRNRRFIEYQLQKYYNFRVKALTHEQVAEMSAKVEKIATEHNLETPTETTGGKTEKGRTGKRPDHDALPDEIKALFVENLSIVQRMREVHLRLRSLSLENATCPDSERYPFLKELIELDKKLHGNWETYDSYNAGATTVPAEKKAKTTSKKAASKTAAKKTTKK